VSSRQEEKERRRREREEREAAEASKVASKRRLQLVAGGVLGIAAIAAVIAAVVVGSGGGDDGGDGQAKAAYGTAALPARKVTDFDAAVKAAGCVYTKEPNEGSTHLDSDNATNVKYKTNPPSSGNHRPTPAADGVYAPENTPEPFNYVHTLEHGRIELQYSPKASQQVKDQLNTLFNEKVKGVEGYHTMLFQNNTNMPYEVAAVAWTQILGCKTVNDKTWDALRAFRDRFTDKGPEIVP
jgi:hypothetical protein